MMFAPGLDGESGASEGKREIEDTRWEDLCGRVVYSVCRIFTEGGFSFMEDIS